VAGATNSQLAAV